MNEDALTVIRAFSMEKAAKGNCHVGDRPMEHYMRSKAKTKETKEARAEVIPFDSKKATELSAALEKLAEAPGQEKAAAGTSAVLNALKQLLKYTGSGAAIGGTAGGLGGAIRPQEGKSRLASALRGLMGGAITGGGVGLGAGVGAGVTAPEQSALLPMLAGIFTGGAGGKALSRGVLGGAPKQASSSEQNTDDDDEGDKAKPGIERLESASDEKPKKAPKKKPEEESENEIEYKISGFGAFMKKALSSMGQPSAPLTPGKFGEPMRDGMKSNIRQDMFNALSKWSLGQE